jgi:hypothetical protein
MNKQDNVSKSRISRRTLMATTGAALVGAAAVPSFPAQQSAKSSDLYVRAKMPTAWLPAPARRTGDAAGISGAPSGGQHRLVGFIDKEEGLKNVRLDGKEGFEVMIKPQGYRGIPLWGVHNIELKIDGTAIDTNELVLSLNNSRYKIADLKNQYMAQWWVFDWGRLFAPKANGLTPGEHEVEIRMTYASVYGDTIGAPDAVLNAKERLALQSEE